MKQLLGKGGRVVVEEIPAPRLEPGSVLVETAYSCVSTGTESAVLRHASRSLARRILDRPADALLVARMALEQGLRKTAAVVRGKLEESLEMGYSAAGMVLAVGEGISDVKPGELVACAGARVANHAEILAVPRNLLVKVPEGLPLEQASTVTLGAIALQSVRRAQPTLGESFLVIGLGVLGQLVAQLLAANGCRVAGMDLDASRLELALRLGLELGIGPDEDAVRRVHQFTDGHGADGVILAAASPDDSLVAQAFQASRKKGRVVLVGSVGLNLNRDDLYAKELDFLISASYGPGRYDPVYEQKGIDYPFGYVRWTENRNMQEYLRLVARGAIQLQPLIQKIVSLQDAPSAYQEQTSPKPLMVLFEYEQGAAEAKSASKVLVAPSRPRLAGATRIAIAGAGVFAKETHAPNLQALGDFTLAAVMSRTGSNAKAVARQYGAHYATTSFGDLLEDPEIDAVLISTRHHLHASMAAEAVRAGKHVFLEKPMALSRAELKTLVQALTGLELSDVGQDLAPALRKAAKPKETGPQFMVGFNRRFSPYLRRVRELTLDRLNPMMVVYRVNAGQLPGTHWTRTDEGGGRNLGEACHIYDVFTFLTGAAVESIDARGILPRTEDVAPNENFSANIRFQDGSVCNLIYTAQGSSQAAKEEMDVYTDGTLLRLRDYRSLEIFGRRLRGLRTRTKQKGHMEELGAFAEAIRSGKDAIPLWQMVQATEIGLRVEELLRG